MLDIGKRRQRPEPCRRATGGELRPGAVDRWLARCARTIAADRQRTPSHSCRASSTDSRAAWGRGRRCCRGQREPDLRRSSQSRLRRYARWALAQGLGRGRHRRPADGQPARIPGHLARADAGRRHGRAAQHPSGGRVACPLLESPGRVGLSSPVDSPARPAALPLIATTPAILGAWAAARPVRASTRPSTPWRTRRWRLPSAPVTLRDRALLHLHLGHDGPAEGRQRQPSPVDELEPLVRRADRHGPERPHVRLPAALPQRSGASWRRAACWSAAARW